MIGKDKENDILSDKGCPLIGAEHEECYSSELNVHNMTQAIHYCLGNYMACEMYMKLKKTEKQTEKE